MNRMPDTIENEIERELTLEEKVLQYFVDLYKKQMGLRRRAGSETKFLEASRFNPKLKTYDVHINAGGSWMSRRVTLGPIGEGTGSKSSCFYAIYDNKLVVKVPPTPLTDFETYIRNIQKERRIIEKLHPRESIVPSVSVIFKKIHSGFEAEDDASLENKCTEWLRENPEQQKYLMINDTFVYFMDLSRYLFLSDAISLFHGAGRSLTKELLRDPTIVDDFEKFEGRYGLENAQLGMDLQSVCNEFENRLRKLMIRTGASPSLLLYKTHYWFFLHIAGKQVDPDEKDMSKEFVDRLNTLLDTIIKENQDVIKDYRGMVREHLQHSSFSRHLSHMAGVAANILELLAWLKQKGVAIRDIKPDNLLVAGDPNRYPNFLATPSSYSIGLIDVETAVDFAPDDGKIRQPQLGGTPFYATPLHMFGNKALSVVYSDLPRVFYLQDWYAAVAMIYGMIVGDYLFSRTARQLMALTKNIQQAFAARQPPEAIIRQANVTFWRSAVAEFEEKTRKNEDQLRAVQMPLNESVQKMFIEEIQKDNTLTEKRIKKLITRQQLFKNKKNMEQLYHGSPEKIAPLIAKLKKENQAEASLAILEKIYQLKMNARQNRETMSWIASDEIRLPVYNLLEIMFTMIRRYI